MYSPPSLIWNTIIATIITTLIFLFITQAPQPSLTEIQEWKYEHQTNRTYWNTNESQTEVKWTIWDQRANIVREEMKHSWNAYVK
jgi:hypothetical protein